MNPAEAFLIADRMTSDAVADLLVAVAAVSLEMRARRMRILGTCRTRESNRLNAWAGELEAAFESAAESTGDPGLLGRQVFDNSGPRPTGRGPLVIYAGSDLTRHVRSDMIPP